MDDATDSQLFALRARFFPESPEDRIGEWRRWAERSGARILAVGPGAFPGLGDPPEVIFVRGDPEVIRREALTVVGTRRPSADGKRAAFTLGRDFARAGVVVVSGLARGIDTQAHQGALRGGGATVAVLAHGLDRIYPAENRELAENILSGGGCLVSEYPPGVPPRRHQFPARNRILAALGRATVVVEAAARSGSLITAGFALEQGRDVFVVPGSFESPSFAGSHRLLSQGAKPLTAASDILDDKPPSPRDASAVKALFPPRPEEITLAELFARSRLSLADLEAALEGAVARGEVSRTGWQRYLWVGS